MIPVAQNSNTGVSSQGAVLTDCTSSSRVTPWEADTAASWSQRHITELPTQALPPTTLSSGGGIVQTQDTCQPLPEFDKRNKKEVQLYSQLPSHFRYHYPQSLPWQKWLVQNAHHPFTNPLPANQVNIPHRERQAAVFCFHTLENMKLTPKYCPVKVFGCYFPWDLILHCSEHNSELLLYQAQGHVRHVRQDLAGSWKEGMVNLQRRSAMKSAGLHFGPGGLHLSIFGFDNSSAGNKITVMKRCAPNWSSIHSQRFEGVNDYVMSPSGQYLALLSEEGIKHICYFHQLEERWRGMALDRSFGCEASIQRVAFSPSKQPQLAIEYPKKLVMLSMDQEGGWARLWETDSQQNLSYSEFCPSGRWLLTAFEGSEKDDSGSVVIIELGPEGQYLQKQVIAEQYLKLTFSPAGAYLVSQKVGAQCCLWRLAESGQWQFYGELAGNGTPLWPELGQMNLKPDIITFSPCDNYLLTSTEDGAVHIWGRDEQGKWIARGSAQHDNEVIHVEFSLTGIHALTVDDLSIRIWGCNDSGLWTVKGLIRAKRFKSAHFHPIAEHLVIIKDSFSVQIWELRKGIVDPINQTGSQGGQ